MRAGRVFLIAGGALALLPVFTIRQVPQASAVVVERLGRYTRTLNAGLNIVVPGLDVMRDPIDLREQVVRLAPRKVLTREGLAVSVDAVVYYQVTDARSATYEVADHVEAIESLVFTVLRAICADMNVERVLDSRTEINAVVRGVLDEATGKWGIRVNRVELDRIEPPAVHRKAMKREMKARSARRVADLREGVEG